MDAVQILSALGNVAVLVALVIAVLQLRDLAKQRQEEMVLRVYAPFFDPEFSKAYWMVQTWRYTTFEQFDAEATLEEKAALNVVRMLFETMGLMYKRGLAEIEFLDDLLSSPTLMTWSKIAPIIHGYRAKANAPDWSRWHEALAIALARRLTESGRPHPPIG